MAIPDPTAISALNAICDAFGLPKNVVSLTIRLHCLEVPTVEVESIVSTDSMNKAAAILTETFELRKTGDR